MKVPGTKKLQGFQITPTGDWIPIKRRAKHSEPIPNWNRAQKRKLSKLLRSKKQ